MKKFFSYILLVPVLSLIALFTIAPASQATPLTCNMVTQTGDDDGSFQMNLPFSLRLGETDYNNVYYSTNGTMSFGQPDGTFWDYPQSPSVSLAGNDWVSWGPNAYTSYGYNESSFCIEWSVRPFPQSYGDLTQIRLVVNKFANGSWHGEITTIGWLPDNLRRGIRAIQGGPVVTMAAAFDVNGGAPIEVPPAPAPTSFTEPPAIPTQCWDGSTVYAPTVCPTEPSFTCWDGTTTHYASECSIEPVVICWDNTQVHYQSECSPTPPDIVCWDGQVVPWNGTCRQVPPPIDCWDGTSVNWNEQCTPIPPDITCWDSSVVAWNQQCPVEPTPVPTETVVPVPTDQPTITPTPSETPTVEPSPTPSDTSLVTPSPSPSESPVVSPTPSPTPSQSVVKDPVVPVQPIPTPSESPTPDPSPSQTDIPLDNLTTEEAVSQILEEYNSLEAVPFSVLEEAGLDYSDLPPDQPVMLDNGVVLTAEVADALQIFENPSEILSTVLTDPGKALKALANVGADMTPAERHQSTQAIVAAVIAGQLMNALSSANMIGRKL